MNIPIMLMLAGITFGGTQITTMNIEESNLKEIIELRSEYQKVFLLENGNYEYRFYSSPIHY